MRKGDDLSFQIKHAGEIIIVRLVMNHEGRQILQHWEADINYEQLQ